jgi:hypothetical protein
LAHYFGAPDDLSAYRSNPSTVTETRTETNPAADLDHDVLPAFVALQILSATTLNAQEARADFWKQRCAATSYMVSLILSAAL